MRGFSNHSNDKAPMLSMTVRTLGSVRSMSKSSRYGMTSFNMSSEALRRVLLHRGKQTLIWQTLKLNLRISSQVWHCRVLIPVHTNVALQTLRHIATIEYISHVERKMNPAQGRISLPGFAFSSCTCQFNVLCTFKTQSSTGVISLTMIDTTRS